MDKAKEEYANLYHLFTLYLHQDWTLEGSGISDIFSRSEGLQELSPGICREAKALIEEGRGNEYLDRLFFGKWSAGYEPEAEGFEDWSAVLKEIVKVSGRYVRE
ncbi:contact-dependent growth inhibition system immunity protein [Nocardiopsis changdeensis]|uniref:contact-dependent growth inhibition system immunity protein n=1 Tax=Nocardiopsis changdeensis TaxID=2831969 RepID=UPI003F47E4AF